MRYFLALLTFVFLCSCTNWKAAYFQSKVDLERCINRDYDNIVDDGDVFIDLPMDTITVPSTPTVGKPDMITVVDTLTNEIVKVIYRDIAIDPKPFFVYSRDSLYLRLTILNSIENFTLQQQITIDTVRYPIRVKNHYRTVIEKEMNWTVTLIAGLLGALIAFAFLFLITRRN